jgi:hypothetical protein
MKRGDRPTVGLRHTVPLHIVPASGPRVVPVQPADYERSLFPDLAG